MGNFLILLRTVYFFCSKRKINYCSQVTHWSVSLVGSILVFSAASLGIADSRPFERAMIFTAKSNNIGLFLGMYDGSIDLGIEPDLIVGTCGGALAGAIIGAFPNREARTAYINSSSFHRLMLAPRHLKPSTANVAWTFLSWTLSAMGLKRGLPNIYGRTVLDVPMNTTGSHLDVPFPSGDSAPRVIFLSAEVMFRPGDHKSDFPERKFIYETYFADPDTAERLHGLTSVIGENYRRSFVFEETRVQVGHDLSTAMRASIADPYYISPAQIDGRIYITGGVNLYPLETIGQIADHLVVTHQNAWSSLPTGNAFKTNFGYSSKKRLKEIQNYPAEYWVDLSDSNRQIGKSNFKPKIRFVKKDSQLEVAVGQSSRVENESDGKSYLIPRLRLVEQIPEDIEEFQTHFWIQHELGYQRMLEAAQNPGSRSHLRIKRNKSLPKKAAGA